MKITIGEIIAFISALVVLIKGLEYLFKLISKSATSWLKKGLEPINTKLDNLDAKIDGVDMEACKNYLVKMMREVEQGIIKVDENEIARIYEVYDRYTKLGGNSYIKEKFEDLQKGGKL